MRFLRRKRNSGVTGALHISIEPLSCYDSIREWSLMVTTVYEDSRKKLGTETHCQRSSGLQL